MEPTDITPLLTAREIKLTVGGVAGGLLVGAGAGYLYTKKLVAEKLRTEYEEALSIQAEHYRKAVEHVETTGDRGTVMNDANKPDLEDLVKDYVPQEYTDEEIQAIELAAAQEDEAANEAADPTEDEHGLEEDEPSPSKYHNVPQSGSDVPATINVVNVFETGPATTPYPGTSVEEQVDDVESDDDWDFAKEMRSRTGKTRYVIHLNEFKETPEAFAQISLTWYAGDNTLCDERDVVIDNVDDLVGLENLQQFGRGSEDGNIVYVRNSEYLCDIEILKSPGTHAHEVLGQELRHSADEARRTRSRARSFDDE